MEWPSISRRRGRPEDGVPGVRLGAVEVTPDNIARMTDTSASATPSDAASGAEIDWKAMYAGAETAGTLFERMEMELLELAPDRAVGRIPVKGNTQPAGL